MTNKEKKEYLSRYTEILQELLMLEDLRGKLISVSAATMSDMPKSPTRKLDKLQTSICNYMDCENEFIAPKIDELKQYKMDTYNAIYTLQDSTQRQIMMYRYIYGFKWVEICVKMNYEWRQIHYIHSKALSAIKINDSLC